MPRLQNVKMPNVGDTVSYQMSEDVIQGKVLEIVDQAECALKLELANGAIVEWAWPGVDETYHWIPEGAQDA